MSIQLALIGLPGAGKSAVGRQLARRLGVAFIDVDHEIEQQIGCSIRTYFERAGEAAFRDLEQRTLDELTATAGDAVISTGGGAVLWQANREVLRQRCHVIYLRATPEDLFRRLQRDTSRPLLQVADPLERLRQLQQERGPLYAEIAHLTIDTGRPSVGALVRLILGHLQTQGIQVPGPQH